MAGIDPNKIMLTGENPFIRLAHESGGEITTRSSFWRVIISPTGPGHVLTMTSEITNNQTRIYSDNIALARWIQKEFESYFHPPFGDKNIEVIDAEFESSGDVRSYWTETISSLDDLITMTWYDFGEPFVNHSEPAQEKSPPHGVYTVLLPAAAARLTLNGELAPGEPLPQMRDGTPSSTCCLAFSETWVTPR